MSELTKEEREKEFEILRNKIADVLSAPYHIGSHPPPTPEEISARSKFVKNITEYLPSLY